MTDRPVDVGAVSRKPGSDDDAVGLGREWPWVAVITVVAASIAWIRMPSHVAGWLYDEDGSLFVSDWLGADGRGGAWSVLWAPYGGYQHLIPRIASWLVTATLPVSWWALAVNGIACVVVGLVAGLVFLYSRDVVTFWPSRLVLGLITVLTPAAGLDGLGNLANLHWFMVFLTPWLLLATPRSTAGMWLMAATALLSTATEPQCAIFLPLALWSIVRSRRTRPVIALWLVGVAAQVVTTLLAPRVLGSQVPPLESTIEGYVLNVGMSLGTQRTDILGRLLVHIGWWVGFVGVASILAVAALGLRWGRPIVRVAIVALLYGSVVSWTASYVLGMNPAFFYSEQGDAQLAAPMLVRWGTAASMLLVAIIPVTVGAMVLRYPRWWAGGVSVLGVLLTIWVINLVSVPTVKGPTWMGAVEDATVTCLATPTGVVKLSSSLTPDWEVAIPCSRLTG